MNKYFLILIIFLCSPNLKASDYSEYFSLKVGNVFVYGCTTARVFYPSSCSSYFLMKISIDDTVRVNSKKYYHFTREVVPVNVASTCYFETFEFPFNVNDYNLLRLDSSNGAIYYYDHLSRQCVSSTEEVLIDSLSVILYDTVKVRCTKQPYSYFCIDTTGKKVFYSDTYVGRIDRVYTRGIGLVQSKWYRNVASSYFRNEQMLRGRVIDGVVYGDTSFPIPVGINISGNEIPDKYELSQNYPNPFNPTTHFGFRIADFGFVRLVVYDVQGRVVQVLVNQELSSGTYEVDFDGSNLPSGVYYYRLEAGGNIFTRKMVLIK